jgi:hypothetical protein
MLDRKKHGNKTSLFFHVEGCAEGMLLFPLYLIGKRERNIPLCCTIIYSLILLFPLYLIGKRKRKQFHKNKKVPAGERS